MPRPATGGIQEKPTARRGTAFHGRFTAFGKRQCQLLGYSGDGLTRPGAERELANILADVRRGIWRPPAPDVVEVFDADPTFHEFASEWWMAKKREVRPNTVSAYENELSIHLLPFFARHRLSQITVQEVDRYRQHKVREGRLGAETINKTLTRLAQVLEVAVEYELIAKNPASGKRRRLKVTRPRPVHLDTALHIAILLEAATVIDGAKKARTRGRRAAVAALVFGGLRASELGDLVWRDVDLAAGRIYVGRAKTDAGVREVDLLPVLRSELIAHKLASRKTGPDDYVFPTARGARRDKDNVRTRVLQPIVAKADELLAERELQPLPQGVTPHKLRHTFASVLIALGRDPSTVMAQLGHTDPKFTLRVYSHAMRRGDGEKAALRALVEGAVPALDDACADTEASIGAQAS
jgi:integrase